MKTIEELITLRKAVADKIWSLREERSKLLREFNKKLDPLEAEYDNLSSQLSEIKDAYLWVGISRIYGHSKMFVFNNGISCADTANHYCGDNGFFHVLTTCKDVKPGLFREDGVDVKCLNELKDIERDFEFGCYICESNNNLREVYQKLYKEVYGEESDFTLESYEKIINNL